MAAIVLAAAIVVGSVWIVWRVSQVESHPSAFRFPTPGADVSEGARVEIEPAERARLESVLRGIESPREKAPTGD